jgi:hypothetical protein
MVCIAYQSLRPFLRFHFPLLVSGHFTVAGEQATFLQIAQFLSLVSHQSAKVVRDNKPGWPSPGLGVSNATLLFAAIPSDSDPIRDTIVF